MVELRRCPFCGSEAELIQTEKTWMGPALILVKCKKDSCGCQTPTLVDPKENDDPYVAKSESWDKGWDAEKALIEIWNRRVRIPKLTQE